MPAYQQMSNGRPLTHPGSTNDATLSIHLKLLAWLAVAAMLFGSQAFAGTAADPAKAKGCDAVRHVPGARQ